MDFLQWVQALPILSNIPIIIAVFWMVMTERLVPRRTVDRIVAGLERVISSEQTQATVWREVAETRGAAIDELVSQNALLLDQGEASQHLLEALVAGTHEAQRRAVEG